MKKYIVVKKIGDFSATVEREFDDKNKAGAFASLLTSSEDGNWKYFVYELVAAF